MKNIALVVAICSVTNVNAGMNKCVSGDKTTYQSSPCPNEEDKNDFFIKYEISKEQIQAARDKKAAELAKIEEQRRLDQMAYDRERMIRAEEDRARAEEDRARAEEARAEQDRSNMERLENEVKTLKNRRFIYRPRYDHKHEKHHFDHNHGEHHKKQQTDDSRRGEPKARLGRVILN